MKKFYTLLTIFLLIVFIGAANAVEWKTANQITIAWDAYTTNLQPGDQITYKIYSKQLPNGEAVFLNEVSTISAVITFPNEGRYILGVQTVRGVDEDGNGIFDPLMEQSLESEINWSDVNGEETPVPFGVRFFKNPGKTKNLRAP